VTVTSLFDVLARDATFATGAGDPDMGQLLPLARKMIANSLTDLSYLRGYEQDLALATVKDPKLEVALRQTIWQLYQDWAGSAQELYQRVRSLRHHGITVDGIDKLNDEIGRIEARLTVKPEQLAKARQQVRDGQTVPAKELRDEFNARLRG
jgi:hypothetical protein